MEDTDVPQPYRGKEKVVFGGGVLLQRPLLAAHIAEIAHIATLIDEAWGYALADMLDADAKVGMEIYLALTGTGAHRTVLNTVASLKLTDQLRADFAALIQAQLPRSRERNDVVHGRWGILPSRDDVLILGERNWTPRAMAQLHDHLKMVREFFPREIAFEVPKMRQLVYGLKDFEVIEQRLTQHRDKLGELQGAIAMERQRRRALAAALRNPPEPPPQPTGLAGLLGLFQPTPEEAPPRLPD